MGQPAAIPMLMMLMMLMALAAACMTGSASAQPITPSYIYGIDDDNLIWQISPDLTSSIPVYNTGLTPGVQQTSNAFAFDRVRDQMFFLNRGPVSGAANYTNDLWLWNKPLGTFQQIATGAQLGIAGVNMPANAAYYANAFWFFREGTNNLYKAPLVYASGEVGTVPTLGVVETFTIDPAPELGPVGSTTNTGSRNTFGDIAINVNTGVLYASTAAGSGANFYSLSLTTAAEGTVGGFSMIKQGTVIPDTTDLIGMQISFNQDYTKLYGHNYSGGAWYEINISNGNLTALNFNTVIPGTSNGLRDIGGASIEFVPEPSTTGLVLSAAAVGLLVRRRGHSFVR